MSSDKAHFAWVIARDLFGYWSRPEPTQCICQCPENVCSCPALECSAHLEVIKELSALVDEHNVAKKAGQNLSRVRVAVPLETRPS